VEDEFALGLDAAVAADHDLRVGVILDPDQARAALSADATVRAYNAALATLSSGTRTTEEVRRRLVRKGFDEEAIDTTVRRLQDNQYLDDRCLARDYASARVRLRGEGVNRIRLRLRRRGVEREIVDEVIAEMDPEIDWLEVAREQARIRCQRLGPAVDTLRRRKRLYDFLVRKGFEYDVARRVTAEFDDQKEDND
jgi:regulatory protein